MAHAELLRRVSIFRELDEASLQGLDRLCRVRSYNREAVVCSEDERGDALYVVAEGQTKAVLFGPSGREVILSLFRVGDFFGEMSLLDDQPRSATVMATVPSKLLVLERSAFARHLLSSPRSAIPILAELSRRLRKADEVIGNLALLDVYARVATQLREMARKDGERTPGGVLVRERPNGSQLAAMLGTTRETVSRVLSDFQRRGYLKQSGRHLILHNDFLIETDLPTRVATSRR
jgi:CRP/FNR family transcriptional regulator, cyclic AMP receptor protein